MITVPLRQSGYRRNSYRISIYRLLADRTINVLSRASTSVEYALTLYAESGML